ncbi:alpha/beta fold hydrolase [Desulfitobacterium hafniense]|uniref:AB hydrolase-1 domain-containing protein n=5 Tax=root TaxID=1 RepID=Q24W57_DESHY|nr:alpha/beta hydrolase [Desulfitobacterium hafniense]ACL21132.1 Ndr family protein [Desulfitobacterium hafniense DCB-2]EHL06429.1 Ndr family protein [Desulfitobacterium hafniense DP7]KTE93171.1 Ndr family protein [Desulfitobacterium hafniense]MEA5022283.1 alpha/beta hydrolase [Desulfitobacterium hafniense]CDX02023.1 Carboxylesterase YbfK [Desulfitobacterium hafniense]
MKNTVAFKTITGRDAVYKAYDAFLGNMGIPHEEVNVDTRFGKAFVIAAGKKDAPVLVLLHGSGINSVMWIKDMEKYSEHYRVYAVDLQGEPGKSDGKQLSFEGSDFDNWLHDVFAGLSVEKASIAGISLGAWLALKFAIANPQMVDKLVLLCPAGVGPQKTSFAYVSLFHMLLWGEKGVERLFRKVNGGKPIPQEIMDYQKLLGNNFNFRREQVPLFSDAELTQLTIPSILFVGQKDVMFHSLKTAQRYRNLVPDAKVIVLREAGHTLIGLVDDILEFLQN